MALLLPPPKARGAANSFAHWVFNNMVKQPVSDAKWSLTHPSDRIHGYGRASQQSMEIPFFKFPPKSILSDVGEGFELRRVPHAGTTKDYTGKDYPFEKPPKGVGGTGVAYNLHAPDDEIVGAVNYLLGKNHTFVDTIWVKPELRKTRAFQELATIPMRHNKRITGAIVNPRLAEVFNKWMKRQAKPTHFTNLEDPGSVLDAVMEAGIRTPSGRRAVGRPLTPRQEVPAPERASHIRQGATEPLQVLNQLRQARGPQTTHVPTNTLRVSTHAQPADIRPQAVLTQEHLDALRARSRSPRRPVSPRDVISRLRNYGGR